MMPIYRPFRVYDIVPVLGIKVAIRRDIVCIQSYVMTLSLIVLVHYKYLMGLYLHIVIRFIYSSKICLSIVYCDNVWTS